MLARSAPGRVGFVFLDADEETIRSRLARRKGHYMPPSLLDSQLETLERPGPGEAVRVEAVGTPAQTARAVIAAL
jgi:gluconokinase